MTQSLELLQVLDESHARFLDRHQQMVLAGTLLAMSTAEMADLFTCSPATIQRARGRAIADVFDFTEFEGTPQLLRLWSERHWTCCTAGVQEMIEKSQLLGIW